MTNRRSLLVWVALAAGIYGLRAVPWDRYFISLPEFLPLAGLEPFRTLDLGGATSASSNILIGIGTPDPGQEARRNRADAVRTNLCRALFGSIPDPAVIPIAYFSEFRCPYCRVLEQELATVLETNPGAVRLVQHELPIFGPPSEYAARASVAAARQGLQQELRRRLMRSPLVPDPALISRLATEVGLNADRLLSDMSDPAIQAELDQTRALADVFGFVGTPGLVIGRTVLNGAVKAETINRILAAERKEPPLNC